ncbi:MAG: 3,4-dihydroxy-2-butanone-4-phosphate synthase [Candidatus Aenigmarchaeota archaeon]|nr:3,4-dihydroxy-2-butanone-4-phosphate synthase [Candidatus Aenigmarchaeota archaeon]
MNSNVKRALIELKEGKMIVLYDEDKREGEADLIFHAASVNPEKIETLRRHAGGLICLAIGKNIAERLNLPFISDVLASNQTAAKMIVKKTAYGDKPAFSIAINHKSVYTGIPDNDRALTIREFAKIINENNRIEGKFVNNFYTPGHVFLLIDRGLEVRRGHTELSIELAKRSGLSEAMVLCEMLGEGKALSKKAAMEYAKSRNLVFLEGREIYG